MAKTKEISRRIKSVSSTKKITKAMEMVAASKMRKAIEAVLKTRTYANLSWETVLRLAEISKSKNENLHPLLSPRAKISKVAIILITSNRGMCGAYNSAVIAKAKESIARHPLPTDFILSGKKGTIIRNQDYEIAAEFEKSDILTDAREIYPLVKMALDDYQSGKYDKILVAYTDFVSAARQVPRVKQLLPVEIEKVDEYLGVISNEDKVGVTSELIAAKEAKHLTAGDYVYEYTFEPSAAEVLDTMIPRLLEIQLYQAFLEANASEHSASMSAMHQATEAASDMVSELTLFYNKVRQAGITAEIAEISAGANALAE
ncbi:MAG: ATP synthase F1 subunit gamma [Candidatus Falkowbacteria bacterium]|nr:MAG: ATP synthase F1 subunit gamma [Candidatus Falkowbacteria bacterium]